MGLCSCDDYGEEGAYHFFSESVYRTRRDCSCDDCHEEIRKNDYVKRVVYVSREYGRISSRLDSVICQFCGSIRENYLPCVEPGYLKGILESAGMNSLTHTVGIRTARVIENRFFGGLLCHDGDGIFNHEKRLQKSREGK